MTSHPRVTCHMERDIKNKPYWIKTEPEKMLQGLVALWQYGPRIYVLTDDSTA